MNEFSSTPTGLWIVLGLILFMGVIMAVDMILRSEWLCNLQNRICNTRKRISDKKKDQDGIWNFNPFILLFGGIAIIFILVGESIANWWQRHKWNVVILLINAVFLVPLFLTMAGVIEKLPEFFFPFFIFYLMAMMGIFVARADNKRSGHNNHYDNRYDNYPNHRNTYGYHNQQRPAYVKPKPKGLSKEQVAKKKLKIRAKLVQEKIIQE